MSSTTINTEQQELHAERRAARRQRDLDRRAARGRKRSGQVLSGFAGLAEAWETINPAPAPEEVLAPRRPANDRPALPVAAPVPAPISPTPSQTPARAPRAGRPTAPPQAAQPRHQRIAEFSARREELLRRAHEEVDARIERDGARRALDDALAVLAQPRGQRWQPACEQLDVALVTGSAQELRDQALAGARRAAGEAARTGRRAPNPEVAFAVCVAFLLVARAPEATLNARRRQARAIRPVRRAIWR